jgi:hypothetical protein
VCGGGWDVPMTIVPRGWFLSIHTNASPFDHSEQSCHRLGHIVTEKEKYRQGMAGMRGTDRQVTNREGPQRGAKRDTATDAEAKIVSDGHTDKVSDKGIHFENR